MVSRLEKVALSIVCLAITGGVLYTHFTGQLYPGLPVGGGIAVLALAGFVFARRSPSYGTLAGVIGIGLIYRLYAYLFPASMIGYDPDAYAVRSLIIILTGSTSDLVGAFYGVATAFSVFGAEVALITDLPVDLAYAAVPLLAATLIPLGAFSIAYRLTRRRRLAILAAILTTLAPTTIKYSIKPAPIFFSALLFTTIVVCLVAFSERRRASYLTAICLLIVTMALSHKIPVFLVVLVTTVLVIASFLGRPFPNRSTKTAGMLLFISVGILALQWLYVTTFVQDAIVRIISFIGLEYRIVDVPRTAAVPFDPSLVYSIIALGYIATTLAVGGIVWLLLLQRRDDPPTARLLAIVAVTVGIALSGFFFSATGSFQRTFFFATAALAALLATGYQFIEVNYGRVAHHMFVGALVLVLVSQPLSATATPDYRDGPRHYLTQGEVRGKMFVHSHTPTETVYMDAYYWDEVVEFKRAARGGPLYQQTVTSDALKGVLGRELTNGTLLNKEYPQVLLRTDVGVYRMDGGRWILTWNPVAAMQTTTQYHQTYSNGDVVLFSRTKDFNGSVASQNPLESGRYPSARSRS